MQQEQLWDNEVKGDDLVSAEGLADWLGCSVVNVHELVRRGVIERTGRGRYPLKTSIRAYAAHMRKLVITRGEGTPAEAKGRLARASAEFQELKTARLRGELIETELVQSRWVATMTRLRGSLLALPARVQQLVPHLTAADIAAIDAEIRAALTELVDSGSARREEPLETGIAVPGSAEENTNSGVTT